jgi:hypothetical protein
MTTAPKPDATLRDALTRIAAIETHITEAIEAFEAEYGAEIVAVTLHKAASGDPRRQRTYRVQAEVRL